MSTTIKPTYGASAAITSTNLQSLANDSTNLLAGWMSAVIDNTSNLSIDELISLILKAGTSPTAGNSIEVWAWSVLDDTPTYPDTITGSEGTVTLTSANVKAAGAFKLAAVITVDATSSRLYHVVFSLAQIFGGQMPRKWGLLVINGSGVALASSGNVVSRMPMQLQNV